MAVATVVTSSQIPGPEELTVVSAVLSVSPSSLSSANHVSNVSAKSSLASEKPVARIDDSPSPCIGLAAAKLLDVEPEMDGDRKRLVCSRSSGCAR
jgi:protein SMG6